jgi:hypothetical protein
LHSGLPTFNLLAFHVAPAFKPGFADKNKKGLQPNFSAVPDFSICLRPGHKVKKRLTQKQGGCPFLCFSWGRRASAWHLCDNRITYLSQTVGKALTAFETISRTILTIEIEQFRSIPMVRDIIHIHISASR